MLPLGGAFAALGPKVLAAGAAFVGVGASISVLTRLSTGLFNLWRESEETLDRFRLSLASAGVGADAVDEKLRTLRDTVRFSTLTAFREAEPRIANLFARLPIEAQTRVDELANILTDLNVLPSGEALTFSVQLELGVPDFTQLETVAQGIGEAAGSIALEDIFNEDAQGRVQALVDYIDANVIPRLSEWEQANINLGKAWDGFLLVLGNPLEGLFTPLVKAATGLFQFLTENWATVWGVIKGVTVSALIAIGDALTGGLVSFGVSFYNWVTGLVELAPMFYQAATAWAQSLWAGLTDWIETAAQSVGGFFGDLFSGDLFGDLNRGPANYAPTAGRSGPQEVVIHNTVELDGETLGRYTVRALDRQFGRQLPGYGGVGR